MSPQNKQGRLGPLSRTPKAQIQARPGSLSPSSHPSSVELSSGQVQEGPNQGRAWQMPRQRQRHKPLSPGRCLRSLTMPQHAPACPMTSSRALVRSLFRPLGTNSGPIRASKCRKSHASATYVLRSAPPQACPQRTCAHSALPQTLP